LEAQSHRGLLSKRQSAGDRSAFSRLDLDENPRGGLVPLAEASRYIPLRHRCRTNAADTTYNASGKSFHPGEIVVFDRSWYGRVLVERVEGLASKDQWRRGYNEINEFEQMMVADGIRIAKCFLHITPAEQIRRFKERLTNPLKRWKLSYEDFRNRSRWAAYETAIENMMEKTSTRRAPWYLVPTNDKLYGRQY
jgi:hypothetical protein